MRIVNKKFSEFPAPLRKAIRNLSLRRDGHSRLVIKNEPDIDTFIALSDDGTLMGWAICSREWSQHPVVTSRVGVTLKMSHPIIMIYVRKAMRRKGFGSVLMSAVINKYGEVAVCPWNPESREFFGKLKENHPSLPNAPGYW